MEDWDEEIGHCAFNIPEKIIWEVSIEHSTHNLSLKCFFVQPFLGTGSQEVNASTSQSTFIPISFNQLLLG